jgi:4-alpha-glucanotransferase
MSARASIRSLHELARLYDVQMAYYDFNSRRKTASVESLLAVLGAMGAPVATLDDVPSALRERRLEIWRRPLDPVVVGWEGAATTVALRLPGHMEDMSLIGSLELENGERERWEWKTRDLPVLRTEDIEGQRFVAKELPLQGVLPQGYHRLTVDIPGRPAETLIISSPVKAFSPGIEWESKTWGVFLPLYSLHTSQGQGSFSDLEALTDWVARLGGGVVATLPLLAAFLDEPFEPSPYSPASRLLWNEFYIDAKRAPEFEDCARVRDLLASQDFQQEAAALRQMPLVDYRRQMALKRRVLETLARRCFEDSSRLAELESFVRSAPVVEEYARFRAVGEGLRSSWSQWPEQLRNGAIRKGDYDEEARRYHMYVQWLAHQQMESLSQKANQEGSGLYLDLPLGVNSDGYDVWRNQDLFIKGTRVGAPPDLFFTRGQDWGFPPLHPERIRLEGYKHLRDVFRHHLRYAGVLRIDHVMGLHRLYWVPPEHDARYGAYVRYNAQEIYAILTLESHRQQCWIVGENLGTVPSYVNEAMSRHGLGRMYVALFQNSPDPKKALDPVPVNTVSSFSTHDLPSFAAFWEGADIEDRYEMGLMSAEEMSEQKKQLQKVKQALTEFLQQKGYLSVKGAKPSTEVRRMGNSSPGISVPGLDEMPASGQPAPVEVHAACMEYLSASRGHLILVNLEDLWQETQPQNVPATGPERPNWRRKARYSFEEFTQMPEVVDVLKEVDRLRK